MRRWLRDVLVGMPCPRVPATGDVVAQAQMRAVLGQDGAARVARDVWPHGRDCVWCHGTNWVRWHPLLRRWDP